MNAYTFSNAQLDIMRSEFAKIERVDPKHLSRFHALFAGCTDAGLAQLANAGIKFVSKLAANAQMRRGEK